MLGIIIIIIKSPVSLLFECTDVISDSMICVCIDKVYILPQLFIFVRSAS